MVLSCPYGNSHEPLEADTTMYKYPWIAFEAWLATDEKECRSLHRHVTGHGEKNPGEAVIIAPWPYMA